MKILTVLEQGTWADFHIAGSLEDMGHTVTRFFYGPSVGEFYDRSRKQELRKKNQFLLEQARHLLQDKGLDFIFCYVYDDFLLPQTARELAKLNVPMVNYNVDMVNQWYRQTKTSRYFSRMLCAQKSNMDALAHYGANTLYFPMAARLLEPGKKEQAVNKNHPVAPITFLGTPMPYRTKVLSHLYKSGVNLEVYGKFWQEQKEASPDHSMEKTVADLRNYAIPRLKFEGIEVLTRVAGKRIKKPSKNQPQTLPDSIVKGALSNEGVARLFRNSKINLGFTRMVGEDPWVTGINQVKLRDFEVPLAGGFYLVEEVPEYAELFEPGVEVETWRTPDELLEKIDYYLNNEERRVGVAQRGLQRAKRDHTWQKRFSNLFKELGLDSV